MQELQLILTGGLLPGGTTKPFGIFSINQDGIGDFYIAKVFTKDQIYQNCSVAKEIICCELAKMFDLNVPDYGIINFRESDLLQVYTQDRVDMVDAGPKFCSKLENQYSIFTPATSKAYLKDYELVNIFAFDVFIQNIDRGGYRNKPNLLINDNDLMVIDHELTFPFINNRYSGVDYEKRLGMYQFEKHILIKYLKGLRDKSGIFDEFLLNLSSLNMNKIHTIFDEFDKYNINHFDRGYFIDYFVWAKNNVSTFERYLMAMI